jgi:antitoxin PrlF
MTALTQHISKLTARFQTTVPSAVRNRLKLNKGDQIRYSINADGRVYIEPVRDEGGDPAITAFLDSVEADIMAHPERIRVFGGAMHDRLKALVGDTDVDLEQPLSPDDE